MPFRALEQMDSKVMRSLPRQVLREFLKFVGIIGLLYAIVVMDNWGWLP